MDIQRIEVDSNLSHVTVFKDRAQLFHAAVVQLKPTAPQQEFRLVFTKGEWSAVDRATLQVSTSKGSKDIILRTVQFRTVHSVEDIRPLKKQLQEEIVVLEKASQVEQDKITIGTKRIDAYNQVLEKINNASATEGERALEAFLLDPKRVAAMYQWAMDGIQKQKTANRALEDGLKDITDKLSAARSRLSSCGGDERRTSRDVAEVQLVALKETELQLQLSYIVRNASWTPVYDLRVDSKEKQLGVTYNAMVQQSSGMSWEKVDLELSTANPHFGGSPPTLGKWSISLTPPYNFFRGQMQEYSAPPVQMMMQQMMPTPAAMTNMFPGAIGGAPAPPPPRPRQAAAEAATVSSSSTSTTFSIAGKQTVRCDNTPVKVTILQTYLAVHLRYSAVPKLDTHTYLKARAQNTTGFVFLPGKVNTFADNQFISKSEMEMVADGEFFWTFLGVDDNLSANRKLVHRKLAEKSGMFSAKKTRVEYKYSFTAKNTKKTQEELVVWDQFPITQDKKIVVTVTTPTKEANPAIRFETNDLNAIEWFLDLAPNSTQTFEFCFYVEYPVEERVTGLN